MAKFPKQADNILHTLLLTIALLMTFLGILWKLHLIGWLFGARTGSKRSDWPAAYGQSGAVITRPNQAWFIDITYIKLRHGFVYLTAIILGGTGHVAKQFENIKFIKSWSAFCLDNRATIPPRSGSRKLVFKAASALCTMFRICSGNQILNNLFQ